MRSTVCTGTIPKKKEEKIEQGPKTRSYAKRKARKHMVARLTAEILESAAAGIATGSLKLSAKKPNKAQR